MSKIIDLTGKIFGYLTVVEEAGRNNQSGVTWLCRCNCGNEVIIGGHSLIRGNTKSCGCYRRITTINRMMDSVVDLSGQRFGKLTVIERVKYKGNRYKWLCRCSCGNETLVETHGLTSGSTKSCGCLRYTPSSKIIDLTGKKFNKLTVIERSENNSNDGRIKWKCRCDCGTFATILSHTLISGHTKSCGCLHWRNCTEEDRKDLKLYRDEVIQLTNVNYKKYKLFINPSNLKRGKKYHLDHIYSVIDGFTSGIDPNIIASPVNLQILPMRENIVKNGTSHMILEELLSKYKEFNN